MRNLECAILLDILSHAGVKMASVPLNHRFDSAIL